MSDLTELGLDEFQTNWVNIASGSFSANGVTVISVTYDSAFKDTAVVLVSLVNSSNLNCGYISVGVANRTETGFSLYICNTGSSNSFGFGVRYIAFTTR